ncbi:MAG: sulfatase-like hydrolase/transferase [Betaproteobacteria bacterium]|nr:sulfatase-like hydrolase/transferase [Betaproteobacteria bacterium]
MARPNVVFITSDQQRGDCYGFEGRRVKTPHLDLMARQGTRFSACITPNNVCQPARASILTGLLPLTHAAWDNGVDLDPGVGAAGFAGRFAKAGYATGFIGKAHFSTKHTFAPTGTPECEFSMKNYPPDWHGPYMGFDYVELVVEGHNRVPPQKPPGGQHYEHWYYGDGLGDCKNELHATKLPPDVGAAQTWHSALPPAWHNSTWVGDRTIEFIRNHRSRPFIVWASFPDPHHPFDCPEPWSRLHHPDDVDLPRHRVKDLERRPWWHKASLEGKPMLTRPDLLAHREKGSRMPEQTDQQLRHIIANYYGMISLIDHNVGRILAELNDLSLARDTVVVYTSDHGDWLGDHGLILKGPMMYEGLLRVGLVFRGPGVPAGKTVPDPVATTDLAATFFDYCGVDAGRNLHSRSLRGLIEGGETRDFAYNEWRLHPSRSGVALDLRCVRTRNAKLTLELSSGAGEMYDLKSDPDEMDNLFGNPDYAKLQKELTDMLRSRPNDFAAVLPEPIGMA